MGYLDGPQRTQKRLISAKWNPSWAKNYQMSQFLLFAFHLFGLLLNCGKLWWNGLWWFVFVSLSDFSCLVLLGNTGLLSCLGFLCVLYRPHKLRRLFLSTLYFFTEMTQMFTIAYTVFFLQIWSQKKAYKGTELLEKSWWIEAYFLKYCSYKSHILSPCGILWETNI